MYRCDKCNRQSPPNKPEILRRTTRYRKYANGGEGREIKKEFKLCPKCAKKWDAEDDRRAATAIQPMDVKPSKLMPGLNTIATAVAKAFGAAV